MRSIWQRNIRSQDLMELFFVSAVSSVLLIRFYLHATGYPQIGGGGLHIAHMLWGGILMLAALVLIFAFVGHRPVRLAAILGGIGFGTFIDELGKFITRDNDYFFQPAIALIYLLFVLLFLVFRIIGPKEKYSQKEYLLNALFALEESILHDMDKKEKAQALSYLGQVKNDSLARKLHEIVNQLEPSNPNQSLLSRLKRKLRAYYDRFILQPRFLRGVRWFFIAEAGLLLFSVLLVIALSVVNAPSKIDAINASELWIVIGQFSSAVVSAIFIMTGVALLPVSRLRAYEWLLRATLINILLVQFFNFYREEFAALPELLFNLFILIILRYAIREERRLLPKG